MLELLCFTNRMLLVRRFLGNGLVNSNTEFFYWIEGSHGIIGAGDGWFSDWPHWW